MKLFVVTALSSLFLSAFAQETGPLKFQEVYNLIRSHLPDVSEEDLSRAAAVGLIRELGTKVQLVTNNASAAERPDDVISRRALYNKSFAYLQVRSVDDRLPAQFQKWIVEVVETNSAQGLIIDLRYAAGDSYEAAARVGDYFVGKGGELLLKMASNEVRSTPKPKPLDLPVAVLANRETRGAAEALAALVRSRGAGLVIGAPTAGEARVFQTFTLSTGQQLKIGTIPIQVADKTIPAKGLAPDIAVTVSPAAEKIFYQDPFRPISISGQISGTSTNELAASATNRTRRFNEAELVRRHRSGGNPEDAPPAEDPEEPIIHDPVLARALDFLKGISALQQHRL